jgi:hypothetical protein
VSGGDSDSDSGVGGDGVLMVTDQMLLHKTHKQIEAHHKVCEEETDDEDAHPAMKSGQVRTLLCHSVCECVCIGSLIIMTKETGIPVMAKKRQTAGRPNISQLFDSSVPLHYPSPPPPSTHAGDDYDDDGNYADNGDDDDYSHATKEHARAHKDTREHTSDSRHTRSTNSSPSCAFS